MSNTRRTTRLRAAAQADDGAELSEDVADALAGAMLARLRDRLPAVRCQAALALARLADPGEVRRCMLAASQATL